MYNDRWQKVEQLLSGALSRPADERGLFLDEACGGDPELRREVESLLAWEGRDAEFLDRPAAANQPSLVEDAGIGDLSGKSIAHYKVISKLGEGGMGVVYRARDTRVDRHVALKLLPDEFAQDAARLARFEREAKILASLNHPSIATLHGLEESDGKRFIVMELVEGQTLAHRLRKGRLPVDEALDICRQIAEGLEAAHEKGVIHRDLKPGNVMITREGKVKILDFGLARTSNDQPPDVDPALSPAITGTMTRPGVVLGTAAYMSPEQAVGKPVDKRADIWAFGCIFFESLAGSRAFEGENVTETLAAILKGEPEWKALPHGLPWRLVDLVKRCLVKNRDSRLHDIADARIELEESLRGATEGNAPSRESSGPRPVWRRLIPWAVAGTIAIIAATALWQQRAVSPARQPSSRFVVSLPPDQRWSVGLTAPQVALSHDGSKLVYGAMAGSRRCLYLRRIDEYEAHPIPGTEGAGYPFFSPDGTWVGYFAGGTLWKILLAGGNPQPVCPFPGGDGGSWGTNGIIVFGASRGLWRVPAAGGSAEPVQAKLDFKEGGSHWYRYPQFLPGGKSILFTVKRGASKMHVGVLSLETGEARILIERGCNAHYTATGHLVYGWQGDMLAVPFDIEALRLTGSPVPILQGVIGDTRGWASFSVSENGTLAYAPGGLSGKILPVWVNRKGEEDPLSFDIRHYQTPHLSRDGKMFIRRGDEAERTWVRDLARGTDQPLRKLGGEDGWAVSDPTGKYVAFAASQNGSALNIFKKYLDGSEREERLTVSEYHHYPQSFSPDGSVLAFVEERSGDTATSLRFDIYLLSLGRDRTPKPLFGAATKSGGIHPAFSPDGRWIAYCSTESGRMEVYVVAYPGAGASYRVSTTGGIGPRWSPDGRELFYRRGANLMTVPFTSQSPYRLQQPSVLFEKSGMMDDYVWSQNYDISPDGRRFLMLKRVMPEFKQINVVLNWFEELKRLCPTGKK